MFVNDQPPTSIQERSMLLRRVTEHLREPTWTASLQRAQRIHAKLVGLACSKICNAATRFAWPV